MTATLFIGAAATVTLMGCNSKSAETKKAPVANVAPTTQSVEYTFRGRVAALPRQGAPLSELQIHHEAIPSFRRADGSLGMASMTMPFPLQDKSILPESAQVGDAVEVVIRVEYASDSGAIAGIKITRVTLLPSDTVLSFEQEKTNN